MKSSTWQLEALPAGGGSFAGGTERIYRTLLETMNEGCLVMDADGVITLVNDAFGRLVGCRVDEPLGKRGLRLFDEETRRRLARAFGAGPGAQRASSLEGRIRRVGGGTLPVHISIRSMQDEAGRNAGCVATVTDISEQIGTRAELEPSNRRIRDLAELKRVETSLRASEEKYRSIVETTSEWIWEMDREGRITYSNPAVEEILGRRPADFVGRQWALHVHTDDRRKLDRALAQRTAQKCGWSNVVIRWRHRDGSYRHLESTSRPLLDRSGEVSGFLVADRDVTERHRIQAELERTRQQQLELKDEFISHVSHELRSPLTAIYQFVSILLDGLAGDLKAEQREYLEITQGNVHQLRNMIGDLLEVTRVQTGKLSVEPRRISIPKVMEEALSSTVAATAAKDLGLATEIPAELPAALADPYRVRQVVANLLDNAIKFTPKGGKVALRVGVSPDDPKFLCISVADTGCGVVPEDRERIFERQYQAENSSGPSRKGLGLGLYICKELVDRQGGRIWVESEPGRGSTFSFTLPVFELAPLIAPFIHSANLARGSVALVTIHIFADEHRALTEPDDVALNAVWNTLQRCIAPEMDLVLPRLGSAGKEEVFFVVALADARGAEILSQRIKGQLARCEELRLAGLDRAVSSSVFETATPAGTKALDSIVAKLSSLIEAQMKTESRKRTALK
jgi:PAS domain S-box-containing protein